MKIVKLGLVGLLAAMLSFALAGCGGGNAGGGDEAKAAFAGSWELIEVMGESSASAEDIELMKSMDLTVSLQLKDDGTGIFNLFGESMNATWEASSTTEGTITFDGGTAASMTIADGKLAMAQDGNEMVFQKSESTAASSAEASSAPAEEAASSAPAEASSAPAEEAASSAPAEESSAA